MESTSPVWTESEVDKERVIALDQPEYKPLIILPFKFGDGTIAASVRYRLSEEDRQALISGADLVVTELTFGNSFTPICVTITAPDTVPSLG